MFKKIKTLINLGPPKTKELPVFYSETDSELCDFLSEEKYREISKFPIVSLLPPFMQDDEDKIIYIALGLNRLLMRNLMLVQNISVQGPEDTPEIPFDILADNLNILKDHNHSITGVFKMGNTFSCGFIIFTPTGNKKVKIEETFFHNFILKCSTELALAVGGEVDEELLGKWKFGQPKNLSSLRELGKILYMKEDDNESEINQMVKTLLKEDPGFILPIHHLSDNDPNQRALTIEALERDPYDAQLLFSLFLSVWESCGYQREAMQIIRRAIEVSPGHGKSHMVSPHASFDRTKMLNNSELGYILLRGNTFAVNNYMIYLKECNASNERIERLAIEGIDDDPENPGCYDQIIELHMELENFNKALVFATRLDRVLKPPMSARTMMCIKQNPVRSEMFEDGTYNPYKENKVLIKKIEGILQGNS